MKKIDQIYGNYLKSSKDFDESKEHCANLMEDIIVRWADYLGSSRNEIVFITSSGRLETYSDCNLINKIEPDDNGFWSVNFGINVLIPETGERLFTVYTQFFIREERDCYIVKLGANGNPFEVEAISSDDLSKFYEDVYLKCKNGTYKHVQNIKGDLSKQGSDHVFIK